MLVIFGGILGGLLGAFTAKRRKGAMADILQYAFVFAMICALIGLFATLIIERSMV